MQMLRFLSMCRFVTQLEAPCLEPETGQSRHLGRLPRTLSPVLGGESPPHPTPLWLEESGSGCLGGQAGSRMNEWTTCGHRRRCSSLDQCHTWAALSTSLLYGGSKLFSPSAPSPDQETRK